ncbi:hypothetical protein HY387_00325 [Candidatus Daviesbacteria bacterium]|nr:hypothetical protein [Candidatus Daviesbacteria bacterium]
MNPVTPERRGSVINCNGLGPIEEPSGDGLEISRRRLTREEMLAIETVGNLATRVHDTITEIKALHQKGQISGADLERLTKLVGGADFDLRTYANSVAYREVSAR